MTIKGMSRYLYQRGVPHLGRCNRKEEATPFYLNALAGKRVAIEMAGIIYKQNAGAVLTAINKHTFTWDDGWSSPTEDDVLAIFRRYFYGYMNKVVKSGIIPVAIIEGKAPSMKNGTLRSRSDTKNGNRATAKDYRLMHDQLEAYKKHLQYSYYPGNSHVDIAIGVLRDLGITILRAHHEAEGVCAQLVNDPTDPYHCKCAIIDDYDIFMYGCKAVMRGLQSASSKMGYFEGTAYAYQDILDTLGLDTHEQYQMMCILSGTDYHPNIHNVGCARVLGIIHKGKVHMVTVKIMDKEVTTYRYLLDTYGPDRIYYALSLCDDSLLPRMIREIPYVPNKHEDMPYTILDTHTKGVYTYEDICATDKRFLTIPYYDILDVLEANLGYNVLDE